MESSPTSLVRKINNYQIVAQHGVETFDTTPSLGYAPSGSRLRSCFGGTKFGTTTSSIVNFEQRVHAFGIILSIGREEGEGDKCNADERCVMKTMLRRLE